MKYIQPIGEPINSKYSNGNANNGEEGSIIPAQAIEHPMREIVNVISKSGLTPDANDSTQLWQALRKAIMPTGLIEIWGGQLGDVPSGWLYCQGQAISRTTYADLFAILGTTHGVGDGSTTFNVPDMQRRTVMGRRWSTTGFAVGDTGGAFTKTQNTGNSTVNISGATDGHAITTAQMPSHNHEWNASGQISNSEGGGGKIVSGDSGGTNETVPSFNVSNTGGGGTHSHDINLTNKGSHNHSVTVDVTPPYIAMMYIIKT